MKRSILIMSGVAVIVIGIAIYFSFTQKTNSNAPTNSSVQNLNTTSGTLVPRIVFSGETVAMADAISNPDTLGWRTQCITGFPCVSQPSQFSACQGIDSLAMEIRNQSECNSAAAELIMLLSSVSATGSEISVIPETSELVAPAFQKISDAVVGEIGSNKLYCLDYLQARHCVVTKDGKRYVVRGDFYFQQPEQRSAFDGLVWSLLAS